MRSLLAAVAAFLLVTAVASLDATAQQAFRPPAPAMAEQPLVWNVAMKKRRIVRAEHRRKRHAALQPRVYNPCKTIDGWRAFPTRDPHGYFDTRPVCSRY